MRKFFIALLLAAPCFLSAQPDTTQYVTEGSKNYWGHREKPYVILISADGFRHDFAEKHRAKNLLALRRQGVAAKSMIPSYPSLTFPNHYTIATGLYPSHHGLVDNTFYDPELKQLYRISNRRAVESSDWYGGTPLWVLAEYAGMLSACFYWVGSEAVIQGVRPTYYYRYNELLDINRRIDIVRDWLTLPEDRRPHLITFYMPEVDHAAHSYGPDSKQAAKAVQEIDYAIGKLVRMTDSLKLPVNYIFVSDHGMTAVDTTHTIALPSAVADTSKFFIPASEELLHLYAKDKKFIEPAYQALKKQAKDFDVYKLSETPPRWHYSDSDDVYHRAGDLLLVPKWPRIFNVRGGKVSPGQHGFDNAIPDMHASFYAWGPAFKQNITIEPFENIHVYPLIVNILGLRMPAVVDGRLEVLQPILR